MINTNTMNYKKLQIAFIFLVSCLLSMTSANAQDKKLEKANEAFDKFAFVEAAKLYNREIEKGNNSVEAYTKLGDCHYYNGDYAAAVAAYSKIMNNTNVVAPEYYFRYAQALNNSQNYAQSEAIMKTYYAKSGQKDVSQNWNGTKLLSEINKQSGRYSLKPVEINTPFSDFGTAFYGNDKVVYASAKDTGVIVKRRHSWNDKSFLKLYTADIAVDGGLQKPVLVKGDVNTRYHQSSPAITKDGKTMFFTRNNYIDGKLGFDKKGTTYLKIYKAELVKGEWKNVKELPYPINSDGFSSAHPALSSDETELYFASDRNNKFGNSDLYVVSLKKGYNVSNDLTKLGDEINTLGRETYPFVDSSGILYFSSDGHPGLGGLDVYAAIKDETGKYHVVNLGDGVNTSSDDFAYAVQSKTKKGYFSSNRSGNDDIYGFTENRPVSFDFEIRPLVFGTITENGKPVQDFNVQLFNSDKEVIGTAKTDTEGKYTMLLDPYQDTKLLFSKPQYAEKTVFVEQLKPLDKKEVSFEIVKEMEVIVDGNVVTIKKGDDLTDKLKLKPIYFDFNGYNIRQSSKKELEKVITLMKDRPNISIQVNSYTDSRGRDEFNMKLSKNRAKSTVDYIIKAGIAKERISGEGYGETQLLNHCSNGVKCTEQEHELNRRSEFIIDL